MNNLLKKILWHLVNIRPWPLLIGFSVFSIITGIVSLFIGGSLNWVLFPFFLILIVSAIWWRDVIRESTINGDHSKYTQNNLKLGIGLFIFSEVIFFFGFFWTLFHSALSPLIDRGILWPPFYVVGINPIGVPLLNTAILLASGVTITWRHHSLIHNNKSSSIIRLLFTLLLGIYFTVIQAIEYIERSFSIRDSVYGSIFFLITGFHGIHVIVGSLFLLVSLERIIIVQFSSTRHIGFEISIWYWHFVDVVWLFLYVSLYFWGF